MTHFISVNFTCLLKLLVLLTIVFANACSTHIKDKNLDHSVKQLGVFASKDDLNKYLKSVDELHRLRNSESNDGEQERIHVTGSRIVPQNVAITNNQIAGVDEGGIIKLVDDYLIILRRGMLYAISLKNGNEDSLIPISHIDVTPPGWQHDAWYDEMLIQDKMILVLGYNYDLEASEILRFQIEPDGKLGYKDGFLISSGDYYSSNNYGSRLYQGRYISYIPSELTNHPNGTIKGLPKIAKIMEHSSAALQWHRLVNFQDIHRPLQDLLKPTLHTIISCDPLSENFTCDTQSIISSSVAEYFVSKNNFYLWTQAFSKTLLQKRYFNDDLNYWHLLKNNSQVAENLEALVFKIPLLGGEITATRVPGQPVDQFSFHESNDALQMLLFDQLSPERQLGTGIYNIPFDYFNAQGNNQAEKLANLGYLNLDYGINNRFINNHLIVGTAANYDYQDASDKTELAPNFELVIYNINSHNLSTLVTNHSANRLESLDGLVYTSGLSEEGNLSVSIVSLDDLNSISSIEFPLIYEYESRSHGFNSYQVNDGSYLMGISSINKEDAIKQRNLYDDEWDDNLSSDVFFIGFNQQHQLYEAGKFASELAYDTTTCKKSCFDWYGNTRAIFINDRVFGLSGDELIEGNYINGVIEELSRVDIRSSIISNQ